MEGHRAAFLDRDGTINVEVNYLYRPADLDFIQGTVPAIARLNQAGYVVIVVTNQAGVARGYYSLAALHALHTHLREQLMGLGARIDAFFFCPHHPDFTGSCDCRKPAPGMLRAAARQYQLDLQRSWMIGDSASDLGAGHAAGCRTILVRTGYGLAVERNLQDAALVRPDAIADDLAEAVDHLLLIDGVSGSS